MSSGSRRRNSRNGGNNSQTSSSDRSRGRNSRRRGGSNSSNRPSNDNSNGRRSNVQDPMDRWRTVKSRKVILWKFSQAARDKQKAYHALIKAYSGVCPEITLDDIKVINLALTKRDKTPAGFPDEFKSEKFIGLYNNFVVLNARAKEGKQLFLKEEELIDAESISTFYASKTKGTDQVRIDKDELILQLFKQLGTKTKEIVKASTSAAGGSESSSGDDSNQL